jgi:hypothetical protein
VFQSITGGNNNEIYVYVFGKHASPYLYNGKDATTKETPL